MLMLAIVTNPLAKQASGFVPNSSAHAVAFKIIVQHTDIATTPAVRRSTSLLVTDLAIITPRFASSLLLRGIDNIQRKAR